MTTGHRFGYARYDDEEDRQLQLATLTSLRCDRIYLDHGLIGDARLSTPALELMFKDSVDQTDVTFVVPELGRLATSDQHAIVIFERLRGRRIALEIDADRYDWTPPQHPDAFLDGFRRAASLAGELRRLTTAAGLRARQRAGKPIGGRSKLTPDAKAQVREAKARNVSHSALAQVYNVDRSTITRVPLDEDDTAP